VRTWTEAVAVAEKAVAALPGPERGCKLVTAPVKGRKSFICFDEDTTVKNIKQAIDMGFDVPELIKRFARPAPVRVRAAFPGTTCPCS
jgi:sarcosine oxidase subunit alpha